MENLKNLKILFLEDNKIFAKNTIKLLEFYVKDIVHCESIKKAKELFNQGNIDIIISDLIVTDGNALSFVKYVRDENLNIPIVVLSAHKDEELLFQAIPLGLTTYAIKPVDFNSIEAILEKCSDILKKQNKSTEVNISKNLYYDYNKKLLLRRNENSTQVEEIMLRKKEALFIELLIDYSNKILPNEKIEEVIWENDVMTESALKNFLLRVRKKIGKTILINVQGLGYKLV